MANDDINSFPNFFLVIATNNKSEDEVLDESIVGEGLQVLFEEADSIFNEDWIPDRVVECQ